MLANFFIFHWAASSLPARRAALAFACPMLAFVCYSRAYSRTCVQTLALSFKRIASYSTQTRTVLSLHLPPY